MRVHRGLPILFLTVTSAAAARADDAPNIVTRGGAVRGFHDGVQHAYLGIPYGAAPVGDLRWRPTRPAAPWSGLHNGTQWGARCPQWSAKEHWNWERRGHGYARGQFFVDGSEDCLNLNVFTPPDAAPGSALPVMVYLHGGSDEYGDNRARVGALVEQGVIVVVPNYRLGVFGFMGHPLLTAEDGGLTSPNYGLYDQVEALRWVRDNVAAFGGDPDNVTLFGVSAGAQNAMSQLANPLARGLFHKAIVASGYTSRRRLADLELWGESVARWLGCDVAADVLGCLRSRSYEEVTDAYFGVCDTTPVLCDFHPVIDGITLVDQAADHLRTNPTVPLIVGTNSEEYDPILLFAWGVSPDLGVQVFANVFHEDNYLPWHPAPAQSDFLATLALYPVPGQIEPPPQNPHAPSAFAALGDYMADRAWGCNALALARNASTYAAEHGGATPVYRFYFTHKIAMEWLPRAGAFHPVQDAFLRKELESWGIEPTPARLELADAMTRYWTTFARTGDPNAAGLPAWPAYEPATRAHLELDTPIRTGAMLKERECAVIDPLRAIYEPLPPDTFGPNPPQNPCGTNWLTGVVTDCSLEGYVGPL
jgi:para-nitrobenzyl esterase